MMILVKTISQEINDLFENVRDFKFISFDNIFSKTDTINKINLVITNNFRDILGSSNTLEKTKNVSIKEVMGY